MVNLVVAVGHGGKNKCRFHLGGSNMSCTVGFFRVSRPSQFAVEPAYGCSKSF